MVNGSGIQERHGRCLATTAGLLAWVCLALLVAATLSACGAAGPGRPRQPVEPAASPVTAVAATTPPRSSWNSVTGVGPSARLGNWTLKDRFLVLAALADEGLATVQRPGKGPLIVFRGGLSVLPALRRQGWGHIGDPDGWQGYLFDAYQAGPGADDKLFGVTTPHGATHDYLHPLAPSETLNNSFAAVTPDGQWMVSGEWGTMNRLLVFPTPIINPAEPQADTTLALAAILRLDHPVRDIQGCSFVVPTRLLCASDDPGRDLWPTPDQLLQVTLPRPLDGNPVTGHVTDLGRLPLLSRCPGTYEVEGIDYQDSSHILRVEVRPPGKCGLSIAVYDYHQAKNR